MEIQQNYRPKADPPSNRQFGVTVGGIAAVLSFLPFLAGNDSYLPVTFLGAGLVMAAFMCPLLLSPANRGWMWLGARIHMLVSPLLLALVFFLVVTPVSLIRKVFVRDPLNIHLEPKKISYWIDRSESTPKGDSLRNQF